MLDGTSAQRVGPALRATLASDLARFLDGAQAPPSLVETAWDIAARRPPRPARASPAPPRGDPYGARGGAGAAPPSGGDQGAAATSS